MEKRRLQINLKGQKYRPSLYINIGWYIVTLACVFIPIAAAFFVIISIYNTIEVLVWKYEFNEHFIIERKGILIRNTRKLEYSRIKSIMVEQNILMQIVGIANVKVLSSDVYLSNFKFVAIIEHKNIEDYVSSIIINNRKNTKRTEADIYIT